MATGYHRLGLEGRFEQRFARDRAPRTASAATAPATAEAALSAHAARQRQSLLDEEIEADRATPARRSTERAAMAAVLRAGSVGMRGSETETTHA